ncbi:hypothetical protein PR003_g15830 [Phytophthora rubi]|uniref:Uncharacterized protein n=1 Tax=Phytophthora rubi TaxID=129364 RepID=A0A6A3LFP8_9STRA|nr:hypothetical protein PR001_g14475 [Phytophthora rubi]KAE9328231.1 hypothetical protein PR003_g15830 [Phytophthora rubi]
MQPDEQTWSYAIEDEEAASAAVVEAERVLHRQLQHHLAISPTVDGEVSELDLRRTEYAVAVRAIDEAAAVYHRAQGGGYCRRARSTSGGPRTTHSGNAAAGTSRAASRRYHQIIGGQAFALKLQRKWIVAQADQALESRTTVVWSSYPVFRK